jgi:hypothetical protein
MTYTLEDMRPQRDRIAVRKPIDGTPFVAVAYSDGLGSLHQTGGGVFYFIIRLTGASVDEVLTTLTELAILVRNYGDERFHQGQHADVCAEQESYGACWSVELEED